MGWITELIAGPTLSRILTAVTEVARAMVTIEKRLSSIEDRIGKLETGKVLSAVEKVSGIKIDDVGEKS